MQAWRVHRHGEPAEVLELDEIPEPTATDLAGLAMHMSGWLPVGPGVEPFTDWVILRMTVAALALPDVTMARGTYPVPVAMPYVSGQEGVGVVTDAVFQLTAYTVIHPVGLITVVLSLALVPYLSLRGPVDRMARRVFQAAPRRAHAGR